MSGLIEVRARLNLISIGIPRGGICGGRKNGESSEKPNKPDCDMRYEGVSNLLLILYKFS